MNWATNAYRSAPQGQQFVSNGYNNLGTIATNAVNQIPSSFVSPIQYQMRQTPYQQDRYSQQYPQATRVNHQQSQTEPMVEFPQTVPVNQQHPSWQPPQQHRPNPYEHRNPYNFTRNEIAHDNRLYQKVKKGPPRSKPFIAALVVVFIFFLVFTILLFASGTSWLGIGGTGTMIWMTASVMTFALFKLFRTFQGAIPYKQWEATRYTRIGKAETMDMLNIPTIKKGNRSLLKQILSSMAIGLAISSTYSTSAVLSK